MNIQPKQTLTKNGFLARVRAEIFPLLLPKVKPIADEVKLRYGITGRAFVESDFYAICEAEGIGLADTEKFAFIAAFPDLHGCLMRLPDGQSAIYLRSFFAADEPNVTDTMAHELGHYFCCHTGPAEWRNGRIIYTPNEAEADLFAELLCSQ